MGNQSAGLGTNQNHPYYENCHGAQNGSRRHKTDDTGEMNVMDFLASEDGVADLLEHVQLAGTMCCSSNPDSYSSLSCRKPVEECCSDSRDPYEEDLERRLHKVARPSRSRRNGDPSMFWTPHRYNDLDPWDIGDLPEPDRASPCVPQGMRRHSDAIDAVVDAGRILQNLPPPPRAAPASTLQWDLMPDGSSPRASPPPPRAEPSPWNDDVRTVDWARQDEYEVHGSQPSRVAPADAPGFHSSSSPPTVFCLHLRIGLNRRLRMAFLESEDLNAAVDTFLKQNSLPPSLKNMLVKRAKSLPVLGQSETYIDIGADSAWPAMMT